MITKLLNLKYYNLKFYNICMIHSLVYTRRRIRVISYQYDAQRCCRLLVS